MHPQPKTQIAILPEEIKNFGIGARLYTTTTTQLIEQTPTLYLNQLYKLHGKNKKEMDAIIKNTLQLSKNMPYIIDANHVFFGFKYRTSTYDKDTRGFVNVTFVDHIEDTTIHLTTGETIETLNTFDTLNTNKNNAKTMLYREQLISSVGFFDAIETIRATVSRETNPKVTKIQQKTPWLTAKNC